MYSLLIIAKKYVLEFPPIICVFFFLKYQRNIVFRIPQEAFYVIGLNKKYLKMIK